MLDLEARELGQAACLTQAILKPLQSFTNRSKSHLAKSEVVLAVVVSSNHFTAQWPGL